MNLAQSGVALWKLDIQFYSQLRQFESIATILEKRVFTATEGFNVLFRKKSGVCMAIFPVKPV
ncbi:MAG: hypothetical protein ACM65K_27135 [Microcoleus sp.]